MAKSKAAAASSPSPPAEYTVVARRYRPQQFAELIGQEHVAQALVNALQSDRVAHAYLFTGARGVGKTSAARILAKALNCEKGPTPTPCGQCNSCQAIAEGQDVDVQEIDGASNNKVDDIRDLRQNVGFRPTRGRYKIYIIDEVHMLSAGAFNALLKTLEEPPPHVKFIFATTEVQKLPITILSRCQRFDFAHVGPKKIFEQLQSIVAREGLEADDEALRLIARRAAGSMRDSQSLLDQLLASGEGKLTAGRVHAVLGTAGDDRVLELAQAILAHDAQAGLNLLAVWIDRGLQVGELVDQLIEYWRALMLLKAGAGLEDSPVAPNVRETLKEEAAKTTLDALLAGLDVWATTKARMRGSSHAAVLLEMAVVRLSRLEELLSVGQLVQSLKEGVVPSSRPSINAVPGDPSKKNALTAPINGMENANHVFNGKEIASIDLTEESLTEVWQSVLAQLEEKSPFLYNHLRLANSPAIFGPNSLAIRFHSSYNHAYDACRAESSLQKLQDALKKLLGKPVVVRVDSVSGPNPETPKAPPPKPVVPAGDRKRALAGLPFFQKAAESLGAQIWHVEEGFNAETRNAELGTGTSEEMRSAEFGMGNEDSDD
ncbi:MAG TPA: DNA polymerase III subunit gamma/tau [Urbifossiella sp.]|nr:DNA polymerase III subunit gamma/tau [Urbifossiella sp.]